MAEEIQRRHDLAAKSSSLDIVSALFAESFDIMDEGDDRYDDVVMNFLSRNCSTNCSDLMLDFSSVSPEDILMADEILKDLDNKPEQSRYRPVDTSFPSSLGESIEFAADLAIAVSSMQNELQRYAMIDNSNNLPNKRDRSDLEEGKENDTDMTMQSTLGRRFQSAKDKFQKEVIIIFVAMPMLIAYKPWTGRQVRRQAKYQSTARLAPSQYPSCRSCCSP